MTAAKRTHQYPTRRRPAAAPAAHQGPHALTTSSELNFKDYVLMNLLFDGLIIVQALIVKAILPDINGLLFFAVFLMLGFPLVSTFDFLASRALPATALSEESSP